jgi:hypothetical protein
LGVWGGVRVNKLQHPHCDDFIVCIKDTLAAPTATIIATIATSIYILL